MSLNKVMLIGNLGRDPEVRHLESGTVNATFTLATSERYRDRTTGETKEQTEWHNIVCWRQLAEFSENYLKKGTQIFVEGKLRSRSYTDQNGNVRYVTEIVADSIQLLGRKSDNSAQTQQPVRPVQTAQPAQSVQPIVDEGDDLPF
ncbi:MAG: single-stranded DNA-binding protein [Bacteroidales bacterium]|nr:single-stranded DNA-binding protein [Bacteroidales bacterium]